MAESDVPAVKVYNYICGNGGFAEFSQLLKHPSPLSKKPDEDSVRYWFKIQKLSGSFDSDHALVMTTNQHGKGFGIRIDLKKQMCMRYITTGACQSGKRCKFWHICKEFVEGTCKGINCGRSHDFHDEDNKEKAAELGFEKKASHAVRGIVAGSLPQVCLSYLKNECLVTSNCPYLHVCPSQVRAFPCEMSAECSLSHDFADPHNKNILEQHGFRPPRKLEMGVVRCNILIPKQQKPIEDNKRLLELFQREKQMVGVGRPKENERSSKKARAGDTKTENFGSGKNKTPSKAKTVTKPVTLSGLIQEEANKSAQLSNASTRFQQATAAPEAVVDKVINYICSKGGFATISDLLHHPSPLAKKFSSPEQKMDAKIWLQVQAQSDLNPRISVLENINGEVLGARVYLKEKICLSYASKGTCSKSPCPFWHICKGYLEGKCAGDCGLSHDFHDEGNIKKVEKLGFAKHPSGTIRNIVANSLPQVCPKYLDNKCFSKRCPFLHICSHPIVSWQENHGLACDCGLSHNVQDDHNLRILKQYKLVPQPSKTNIVLCNTLIPKKQRSFEDAKNNLGTCLSSLPQTHLNKPGPQVPPLMSLPFIQQNTSDVQQQQDSRKGSEKKKRKRPKWRKKKTSQHGEQQITAESQDDGEESPDSDSDNEDIEEKPDLYPTSKFTVNPNEHEFTRDSGFQDHGKQRKGYFPLRSEKSQLPKGLCQEDFIPEITANQDIEENLINLSDDDWQGADTAVDDPFTNDLLSQIDDIFFDDWFGTSSVASSLSQGSEFSLTSDQITTSNSDTAHSDKATANSIFEFILREYNGQVPFSEISENTKLFPPEVIDIGAWFRKNKNRFVTIENKLGQIEAIRAFNPRACICFRYLLTSKGCDDLKCSRYHVCKHYLANGFCLFREKCRHNQSGGHSLKGPHNEKITNQLKLDKYSEEQLRILISASVPEVCLEYNSHSCQAGSRCNGIHICKYFVMKRCKKGNNCPLGHESSLETPEAKVVLDRYRLTKIRPKTVLSALLVRKSPPSGKTNSEHSAGKCICMLLITL